MRIFMIAFRTTGQVYDRLVARDWKTVERILDERGITLVVCDAFPDGNFAEYQNATDASQTATVVRYEVIES